jgi:glycosyltransferase domain-containing protein
MAQYSAPMAKHAETHQKTQYHHEVHSSYENLTICIFTRNRPDQLANKLRYWEHLGVSVIVLDASDQKFDYNFNLNTTYLHCLGMPIDARLIMFAKLVKTKYMLLSPDDDFFLPEALEICLNYLEVNPDYSSVQGLRIRLIRDPKLRWIPDYTKQADLVFDSENLIERLRNMSVSMHYVYAIQRTNVFGKIVDCLTDTQTSKRDADAKIELVFNYLLPLFGKHRILPVLYSARTFHEYEGYDIQFSSWINDPYDSSALKFKSNIHKIYMSKLDCTISKARKLEAEATAHFSQFDKHANGSSAMNNAQMRSFLEYPKRFVNWSLLRHLYPISKIDYIRYFIILVKGKHLGSFIKDLSLLLKFLKSSEGVFQSGP